MSSRVLIIVLVMMFIGSALTVAHNVTGVILEIKVLGDPGYDPSPVGMKWGIVSIIFTRINVGS